MQEMIRRQIRENMTPEGAAPDMSDARVDRILEIIAQTQMGRTLLEHFSNLHGKPLKEISIKFDDQMEESHGLCFNKKLSALICLNPRLDDKTLASVLVHEMRHAMQPVRLIPCHIGNVPYTRFFYMRLIEGDAFAHQIAYGLEHLRATGDDSIHKANCKHEGLIEGSASEKAFQQAVSNYMHAGDEAEKRSALKGIFMLYQTDRLSGYDARTIKKIPEVLDFMFERDAATKLNDPTDRVQDTMLEQTMALQKIPSLIAPSLTDHYLGDDPTDVVEAILHTVPEKTRRALERCTQDAEDRLARELKNQTAGQTVTPSSPASPARR